MKVAILGVGNMGGAVARGLVRAGHPIEDLALTRRTPAPLGDLPCTTDNCAAVRAADIVLIAVKPPCVAELLREVAPHLRPGTTLVSLAAALSLDQLRAALPAPQPLHLVRAMPNLAVAHNQGITALAADNADAAAVATRLFEQLGPTLLLPESALGAFTALSGCGLAHALRFLRAGMEAGIEMGLPAEAARRTFTQVLLGAATLANATETHPEALIDQICTPGGYTIRGLNALEQAGFTAATIAGLKASRAEI